MGWDGISERTSVMSTNNKHAVHCAESLQKLVPLSVSGLCLGQLSVGRALL